VRFIELGISSENHLEQESYQTSRSHPGLSDRVFIHPSIDGVTNNVRFADTSVQFFTSVIAVNMEQLFTLRSLVLGWPLCHTRPDR